MLQTLPPEKRHEVPLAKDCGALDLLALDALATETIQTVIESVF